MSINIKTTISLVAIFLIAINIYLFAKSALLGDEIQKIERDISKIKVANSELEKKLYTASSLQNLEQVANDLGFTKKTEPLFLDNLNYAKAN